MRDTIRGTTLFVRRISALMQTLYAAMDSVCHAAAEEKHSDGRMAVIAYKERDNRKEAETLFHGVLCGLELIAEEYADCVRMGRLTGEQIPDCGRGK